MICPICTIAVGAGVGLSRWFGIDDTVTGLWIGGLVVSMIMWTLNWFGRKKIRFQAKELFVSLIFYGLTVVPLIVSDVIGHPLNTLFGIDKLLLGIVIGSIIFVLTAEWHNQLKKRNNGKSHFPFQRVVVPVGTLIIFSIIFYFLTR
jgi:hypothetical protein